MPNDTDAEKYLIGSLLVDSRYVLPVMELLTTDAFYSEQMKWIYNAIVDLTNKRTGIDIVTVSSELKAKGLLTEIGGALELTKLTSGIGSTANSIAYANIIKQKHLQRQLIDLASDVLQKGYKTDASVKELITALESGLTKITSKVIISKPKTSAELYSEAIERNDTILQLKSENKLIGVPTGLKKLDEKTRGWQNGNLIILAARPGMGKTSLALHMMTAPAIMPEPMPTAIFSLEMPNVELYARLLSQLTDVPLSSVLYDGMSEWELKNVLNKADLLCGAPMYFDDQPAMSLFEIQNKARKLKREKGIKLILIDYLQLIQNPIKGANREGEIASISAGLKSLAKELDIPVIALAQLSRASEKRGAGSTPMLSDLRESGAIEQDADIVMFINRLSEYGIETYEDGESTQNTAEIVIAKGRNVGRGISRVGFLGHRTKFFDLEMNNNDYQLPNF